MPDERGYRSAAAKRMQKEEDFEPEEEVAEDDGFGAVQASGQEMKAQHARAWSTGPNETESYKNIYKAIFGRGA